MVYTNKEYIANKIKLARKNARLTQAELAEKIDISAKQLSRIETADYTPSVPTFLKILKELNIDISDFGIETKKEENRIKDRFKQFIYSTSDDELEFYYSIITTIKNHPYLN